MTTDITVKWQWSRLQNLTARELHDILAARQSVFILEQRCAYQDADDLDHAAWHLTGRDEDAQLVAYLRVIPPGSRYAEPSIGRLLTVKAMRGRRLASIALKQAIEKCDKAYPGHAIRVAAQTYLEAFYCQCGFLALGARYVEDGIAQINILRPGGVDVD